MKRMKKLFITLIMALPLIAASQTINEAGEAFNLGIEASKLGNFDGAIQNYLNCITVCEQIGPEGNELKEKATQQIAKQYLNSGNNSYKNKDYSEAIRKFEEASRYAEMVGDTETKGKADNYLSAFYASYGMASYKKEDYPKAIEYFNQSLALDPNSTKSMLGMALVYKSQDNITEMKANIDKCIAAGEPDDKNAEQARTIAYKFFLSQGGKDLQSGNNSKAIENLNTSMEYGEATGETYYYLAVAYNGLSEYGNAINSAQKGLDAPDGDAFILNFELARAYEGSGEMVRACETYKLVTGGPNAEAAKHKVEVELKCN